MVARIRINMEKAREVRRNQIRHEREALLAENDRQFMIAIKDGDIAAQERLRGRLKQLKDAPAHPDIARAKTLEELRSVRPLLAVAK